MALFGSFNLLRLELKPKRDIVNFVNFVNFLQVIVLKYFKRKGGNPADDRTLDMLICGMWSYVYELQDFYHFK